MTEVGWTTKLIYTILQFYPLLSNLNVCIWFVIKSLNVSNLGYLVSVYKFTRLQLLTPAHVFTSWCYVYKWRKDNCSCYLHLCINVMDAELECYHIICNYLAASTRQPWNAVQIVKTTALPSWDRKNSFHWLCIKNSMMSVIFNSTFTTLYTLISFHVKFHNIVIALHAVKLEILNVNVQRRAVS